MALMLYKAMCTDINNFNPTWHQVFIQCVFPHVYTHSVPVSYYVSVHLLYNFLPDTIIMGGEDFILYDPYPLP